MRGVLANRGFAALWLAQLISRIGDSIHEVALIWVVYAVTGDPTLIALVAFASFVPNLLVSVPAGVLVDRLNRKWLLVVAEVGRGVAVLAIPVVGEGSLLVPVVVAVALLASTMEAFFGPAQQALIPRLVPPEDLDAANSLNNLTLSTSRLFYVVGGVIVGIGGSFVAFYVNSATFLIAAAVLLALPAAAGRPKDRAESAKDTAPGAADLAGAADHGAIDRGGQSILAEAREGIRFIRGSPALIAIITIGVFVDFAFVPLVVVLPVFASVVLGGNGATYGYLLGAFFAGTLFGNLLVGHVRAAVDHHRGPVMVGATVLTGLALALAGWLPAQVSPAFVAAMGGLAFAGLCNPFVNVPITTYAQAVVPDDMRGKVFSVMRVGITGAAPIGIALAGPLVDLFGPVPVMMGMGAIIVLAGLGGLFTPLVRLGSVAAPAAAD